jgi:hypothetical protein
MPELKIGKHGENTALVLCLTKGDTEELATSIKEALHHKGLHWGDITFAHRGKMEELPRYITREGPKLNPYTRKRHRLNTIQKIIIHKHT